MNKHTPGPWRIGKNSGTVVADGQTSIRPDTGHDDIKYYGGHLVCESIGTGANARLIAAAPDLLEACEKARQFIENGVENGYIRLPDKPDPALDTLPQICAAIAKTKETT